MTINVVAAYQSPGLFNILARSSCWTMRMAPLGDHDGLAELAEINVPSWDLLVDPKPDVVIVCSPIQFDTARLRWPGVPVLWAIHNGRERWLLPPEYAPRVAGAICFSEKIRWLQQAGKTTKHYMVSPAYEVNPTWTWSPGASLWTLRNRPGLRTDDVDIALAAVTEYLPCAVYGQDQELGVADAAKKRVLRRSGAYVSMLPRGAGFGLAQHEAMASGVPIIGSWWGDLREEMSRDYWGLQDDLYDAMTMAGQVLEDAHGAQELSQLGMGYIRKFRSFARLDETVRGLLRAIG